MTESPLMSEWAGRVPHRVLNLLTRMGIATEADLIKSNVTREELLTVRNLRDVDATAIINLRDQLRGKATTPPRELYVITSLTIDDVRVTLGEDNPERTPIGPFDSKEEAWEYASKMQCRHGSGGGSVDVSRLHPPKEFA